MTSTATFSLSLLAVFVVCVHSLSYNDENGDTFSLDQISANNELEMRFLENNILSGIDSSVHLCDDPHAALCGGESKNRTRPLHLKQAYPYIRNHLIDVLSQPVAINEVTALSIEKTLFSKCMNLGTESDSQNVLATKKFVGDLCEKILDVDDGEWQNIDNKLNRQGFDFTFFDVGVERDPENPKQNVVVIKPPSYSDIKSLYDLVTIAYDIASPRHISKSLTAKFFDTMSEESVKEFFRAWTEVFSQSTTQRKQERMSLVKWNEKYNAGNSEKATSKINWVKLVKQDFTRVNVDVNGKESIIIRNKDYFLRLADLLGNTWNMDIVGAIKTKLILGNIRFIDYKYAEAIKHRKRSLFCYSNTKLYGASFRLLRDLKKENSRNAPNYEILDAMLSNIADIFRFAIDDSTDLMPKEKTYLRAQVKLITSNGIKHNKYRNIVNDYYEDYEISPSYFVSIVNYRKMLKEKELSSLTRYSKQLIELEPFSVIDLAKPRNRFILNVFASSFLLSKLPIPSGLQKEVHYGIYGVKIASFLYGLLNENKFDTVNLTGRVDWYDHPEYPAKSLQCFVGEDVKSYGWGAATATVTQIFGSHFAYKAMLEDYAENQKKRPQEYLVTAPDSELISLKADQLFFRAYGKYHCDFGQTVLKTILLNLKEYNSAFDCESLHGDFAPRCPLDAFQIQRKGHFLNKPF